MNEPENFLERWSRRKREAGEEAAQRTPPPEHADRKVDAPPAAAEADEPFDLDSLPSLDSITAETDVRGFLRAGVPEDLRREALRRAWTADPGVRDFVELLENGSDFNDPNAVAGFGPIEPSDVARLMAQFDLTAPEEKKIAAVEADKQGQAEPAVECDAPESDKAAVASDENAAAQNELAETGRTTAPAEREPT